MATDETTGPTAGAGRAGMPASPLGELLAGLHTIRTERRGLPPAKTMLAMAHRRHGTWRATARALGVSESTLRAWRSGQRKPSPVKLTGLQDYTRTNRRGGDVRTVVHPIADRDLSLSFEYNRKGRVNLGRGNLRLAHGTMGKVADALRRGDRPAAAAAFIAGIGDPWYRRRFTEYDPQQRAHALRQLADQPRSPGRAPLAEQLPDGDASPMGDRPGGQEVPGPAGGGEAGQEAAEDQAAEEVDEEGDEEDYDVYLEDLIAEAEALAELVEYDDYEVNVG